MNEINRPYELIQSIVDTQENLIVVMQDGRPILMNRACTDFFAVSSFEQYKKDFGAFTNNFVPHPAYFNMNRVEEGQNWIEVLEGLQEEKKIVSMLNTFHEPRAFGVSINSSHGDYTVLTLSDISATLIKRIMIENDVSVDKKSGAYNKEYFLHTPEILQDGAKFNEKEIGLTMINVLDMEDEGLAKLVGKIKQSIRDTDMLVKWSSNSLLLAYLVDKEDNAVIFSKKLQDLVLQERSRGLNFTLCVSIVRKKEKIAAAVKRLVSVSEELSTNELRLI